MKTIIKVLLFIILFPSSVFAGEVYGCIKEGKKFIGKGVKVEVTSDSNTYSTKTDKYGSFRLYVKEKGKCILKIYFTKQDKEQTTQDFAVYSYENPVKYDLFLEKEDDKYYLKRK